MGRGCSELWDVPYLPSPPQTSDIGSLYLQKIVNGGSFLHPDAPGN